MELVLRPGAYSPELKRAHDLKKSYKELTSRFCTVRVFVDFSRQCKTLGCSGSSSACQRDTLQVVNMGRSSLNLLIPTRFLLTVGHLVSVLTMVHTRKENLSSAVSADPKDAQKEVDL